MAGKLGKFQMLGFQHWKGLTSDNHLGAIFQQAPKKATNLMVQLLAFYRGKSLDTFLIHSLQESLKMIMNTTGMLLVLQGETFLLLKQGMKMVL